MQVCPRNPTAVKLNASIGFHAMALVRIYEFSSRRLQTAAVRQKWSEEMSQNKKKKKNTSSKTLAKLEFERRS
jgi:hypothetical protein